METQTSLLDRFNNWLKESVMIKLLSIGFLVLILLIPASWIESLIREREARAYDVINEISDKWSDAQTVTGPILMVPFTRIEKTKKKEKGVETEEITEYVQNAYFLPENLTIQGEMKPEVLHRGIFDAVVYDSKMKLTAKFTPLNFDKWNIPDNQIHWKEATLLMGITDLRGISENPVIKSEKQNYSSEPANDIGVSVSAYQTAQVTYDQATGDQTYPSTHGIVSNLGWTKRDDFVADFTIDIQLKGSERLYLVPAGKTTEVKMKGDWGSPSFDGKLLPSDRSVTDANFEASWKILSYNRPFAQQWLDRNQDLSGSEFGVRLIIPADQYQKSMRTSKYGSLIIILAFTALFLVEISSKIRIHPFQYILIGVALIIYYTLLLSLSEHLGYNTAYGIASVATVGLLVLYSVTFLKKKALIALFGALMSLFYTFIFVIIQAQDFSLLIGSIGLFMIIAAIMYFSRNIRWYKDDHAAAQ